MPTAGGQWFVLPPLQRKPPPPVAPNKASYTSLSIAAGPNERKVQENDQAVEAKKQNNKGSRSVHILAGLFALGLVVVIFASLVIVLEMGRGASSPSPPSSPPIAPVWTSPLLPLSLSPPSQPPPYSDDICIDGTWPLFRTEIEALAFTYNETSGRRLSSTTLARSVAGANTVPYPPSLTPPVPSPPTLQPPKPTVAKMQRTPHITPSASPWVLQWPVTAKFVQTWRGYEEAEAQPRRELVGDLGSGSGESSDESSGESSGEFSPPPSPFSSAHTHVFNGTTYYMPDNFTGAQHGGECPEDAGLE
jgi:hypothetical protein